MLFVVDRIKKSSFLNKADNVKLFVKLDSCRSKISLLPAKLARKKSLTTPERFADIELAALSVIAFWLAIKVLDQEVVKSMELEEGD